MSRPPPSDADIFYSDFSEEEEERPIKRYGHHRTYVLFWTASGEFLWRVQRSKRSLPSARTSQKDDPDGLWKAAAGVGFTPAAYLRTGRPLRPPIALDINLEQTDAYALQVDRLKFLQSIDKSSRSTVVWITIPPTATESELHMEFSSTGVSVWSALTLTREYQSAIAEVSQPAAPANPVALATTNRIGKSSLNR
ncbi:hypothetical protein CYMTET_49438 [Cymbomonas tetramitiformis]|uniref:Uncharacterized protein n=1 Tax=Cymbomonas tetramitiformis TaxID=36881 RepID=A0AAE0BRI4_9CHLO|nr:hypothetical protein CYMTET_49438 [Cymbomonas tetramitiformis]